MRQRWSSTTFSPLLASLVWTSNTFSQPGSNNLFFPRDHLDCTYCREALLWKKISQESNWSKSHTWVDCQIGLGIQLPLDYECLRNACVAENNVTSKYRCFLKINLQVFLNCNKTLRRIPPSWPDGAGVICQGRGKYFTCEGQMPSFSVVPEYSDDFLCEGNKERAQSGIELTS